jgi:sodium/proline symporter
VEVSFILFMALFVGVGLYSARSRGAGEDDYWLAGRSIPPWAMALSTLSTAQSGFLWLGMVGLSYSQGLTALWMLAGWLGGDYVVWRLGVLKQIRLRSEARGVTTLPAFLGPQAAPGEGQRPAWVGVLAVLVFLLLGLYASAQVTAGAKVLHSLYEWPFAVGVGLTALVITSYSFAGGVRASIWTDCAQGPVMILGMLWLTVAALVEVGGPGVLWRRLGAEVPGHLALTKNWGWALVGLVGWTISGMGTSGQPHVLSRAFLIDDAESLVRARRWYFAYGLVLYASTVVVGLCARLLIAPEALPDPEVAILAVAQKLLPGPMVGVMIAGIFAAVISTVDSMVIVQSSVVSNDLAPERAPESAPRRWLPKVFTLVAMGVAVLFSVYEESVLAMVLLAWSILACGFGPLVIWRSFGLELSPLRILLIAGVGLGLLFGWPQVDTGKRLTAMAPAFLGALAVGGALFWRQRAAAKS